MNILPSGRRRAVLLVTATLLLPLCYAGISSALRIVMDNKAHAATNATAAIKTTIDKPAVVMTGPLTKEERKVYVRGLTNLVSDNPDMLLRMIGEDVLLILDEPELKRKDMFARVWQYRTKSCVLDIYFGVARQFDSAPVIHYELRKRDRATLIKKPETKSSFNERQCLKDLL